MEEFIVKNSSKKISDIHLINNKNLGQVYIREDGQYKFKENIEIDKFKVILQQIKVKSGMDISEKRLPQDGILNLNGKCIRASTINTINGESLVLRFFNKEVLEIKELGLKETQVKAVTELINNNFSILLICGGTGSGKSTTMKSILNYISRSNKKIITIEDPVEIHIDNLLEVNINEKIGFGYDNAIFSAMRQDPDIISIGEIRDEKTVQALLKASLTGHSIISTIHANSYDTTLKRLSLMSKSNYFNELLTCVISQRLIIQNNIVTLEAKVFINNGDTIDEI